MARKGTFGTGTAPFGGGAPLSNLSAYNIGGAQASPTYFGAAAAQPWLTAGPAGSSWTSGDNGWTYTPPPKPTVAPAASSFYGSLVLPIPNLPEVMLPGVSYVPEETFGQQWQGER